jgi:peptidyl-prolyl cis-trans isomerase SurA
LRKPKASEDAIVKAINQLDSIRTELVNGEYTFEECVKYVSSDKDTKNNYGIMRFKDEQRGIIHVKMELKELPAEVARQVANLNVGEISKPFIMINSKGKEVVAIIKLKDKVDGHKANMKDDYQDMQNVVQQYLSAQKIEEWIKEKQKSTYVRINEDWRNCDFKYDGWVR